MSVPKSCSAGWALAFEVATGNTGIYTDQRVYYISGGKIFRSVDGMQNSVQLTPNEVVIDQAYAFSVLGAEAPTNHQRVFTGDQQQPLVNIRLVGHITVKNTSIPFSLQTTVSQRVLDL